MTFYRMLVFIHVFSAIIGIGPGFVMTYIVTKANNMTELKHAYFLRTKLHLLVMYGGIGLLITGLWMGLLNPSLFQAGWYVVSICLFLVSLAFGPLVLKPNLQPIKKILETTSSEEIPAQYYRHARKLFFFEHLTNLILFIIIALMILKPF